MNITTDELKNILEKHALWVRGDEHGVRADLSEADLYGADLSGAKNVNIPLVTEDDIQFEIYEKENK